jgi:hypothetical protein
MIGRFWFERIGQPNVHPLVALLVGLGILLILTSIPWIGWLFGLAAVIYGAGAVVLAGSWERADDAAAWSGRCAVHPSDPSYAERRLMISYRRATVAALWFTSAGIVVIAHMRTGSYSNADG